MVQTISGGKRSKAPIDEVRWASGCALGMVADPIMSFMRFFRSPKTVGPGEERETTKLSSLKGREDIVDGASFFFSLSCF